ncbi:MAG: ferritin-like domain-containing protein [Vicinamibacteria bacterium]|nr:ferritin-like domain-containing protein [Vicinamibacteria bacterium]
MAESRRAALRRVAGLAGLSLPVVDLLGGARVRASEGLDLEILGAALALEHHALAIYEHGLERGLFPPGLRDYAVEFRGDHLGHRDTQVALMEERGGRAPEAKRDYGLGRFDTAERLLKEALTIEVVAQDAYLRLIGNIRTDDYQLAAAFILVDEVRHATVWKRATGARIY